MLERFDNEVEKLISLLENDSRVLELKKLQRELLSDRDFCKLLEKYQNMEYKSSPDAIFLKEEIYKNEKYRQYQSLENEIYFLILEMNQIFSRITDRKSCG